MQGRAFRIVPVSLVLSLLLLAFLPATTLAADKSLLVWPDEVGVGDRVKVSGDDYDKDYPDAAVQYDFIFVTVYFSSEEVDLGDRIDVELQTYAIVDESCKVDEFGDWVTRFKVPEELPDGDVAGDVEEDVHYVYVTYRNDDVIVAANTVEVTDTPSDDFGYFFHRGYPYSSWRTFRWYGCVPDCDDLPWDGVPYPFPWDMPEDWDDWPDDWPYHRPYYWPFIPPDECDIGGYGRWTPILLPPCDCGG